jgi:diguanylate cyclase (GGDEF)-like protein
MIMIDIDFFKLYNDSLGHPEGDDCLKKIASILKKYFRRPEDLIARYGGEEFCVISSCDSKQINILAETLRKTVENNQITHPNSDVSGFVTISLAHLSSLYLAKPLILCCKAISLEKIPLKSRVVFLDHFVVP